ncbi:hypothetical protein [Rhizobium sp. NFR12]|uniref:hypothetical protein n=1 Tax=Rhizobium sp. NFR12 TaxID=1566261 RepID=UPI0008A747C5|nr:hypothetical protein [Rhizobium sp. NFR12]SEH22519.1 hypothetical protein SAMN03159407_1163 [Rhizobium sp. NFR12]
MYRIDSMYEPMAEAVVKAHQAQTVERWVAAAAFWLGRQQVFGESNFWFAVAAKVTTLLPAVDRAAIEEQLSKQEDLLLDSVGDWPAISEGLQSVVNSWTPELKEIDLDAVRLEAVDRVDRGAEAFRMTFITPGFGQVMVYQQKLAEARAKVANPSVADAEIPHIVAEALATSKTKAEVAHDVVETFERWQLVSASIEGKRMAAKAAIAAAETAEAVKAASAVDWSYE